MVGYIGAALLAGLAGSAHCVGMCGAFALACGGGRGGAASWHLGRVTTYSVLGAVAGWLGSGIPGPGWVGAAISAALLVWFAAALAGLVPEPGSAVPGLAGWMSRHASDEGRVSRYAFGLANGLLPCGLVYATLAIPVASGSALTGALSMLAFGSGTVPALAFLRAGAQRLGLRTLRGRRILAAIVLVAGLWAVAARQGLLAMPGMPH